MKHALRKAFFANTKIRNDFHESWSDRGVGANTNDFQFFTTFLLQRPLEMKHCIFTTLLLQRPSEMKHPYVRPAAAHKEFSAENPYVRPHIRNFQIFPYVPAAHKEMSAENPYVRPHIRKFLLKILFSSNAQVCVAFLIVPLVFTSCFSLVLFLTFFHRVFPSFLNFPYCFSLLFFPCVFP